MFKEFFANGSLFSLPLIAMGLFVAIFLTGCVRVLQRSRAEGYQRMAELPLDDKEVQR